MKITKSHNLCPLCGGTKKKGKTIFAVDLGFGVVVVREVPATVCSQCGADWIGDSVAKKLEKIVEEARKRHNLVEVMSLSK
ncbi:MAG: YgiT-type zinc finger domain-containing protein [Candidatus Fischerbacteria bacterium RBG_13_37_8]|uniref:YgiT-type zinc finger domain-containing protein n=1 Tax=Candidatus Fischerbacteria bacterium RBG_13_37_8 TaxID=1817863 RepID=A0A1F5VU84_9BACT|nr:MAG: YgiT-type zinc finger domain-containing protein [Candidatus Fischerbacteria bacterium RBG_13_37_8]